MISLLLFRRATFDGFKLALVHGHDLRVGVHAALELDFSVDTLEVCGVVDGVGQAVRFLGERREHDVGGVVAEPADLVFAGFFAPAFLEAVHEFLQVVVVSVHVHGGDAEVGAVDLALALDQELAAVPARGPEEHARDLVECHLTSHEAGVTGVRRRDEDARDVEGGVLHVGTAFLGVHGV